MMNIFYLVCNGDDIIMMYHEMLYIMKEIVMILHMIKNGDDITYNIK